MSHHPDTEDRTPRILIVDDDPQAIATLRALFARHRYEILSASNGETGLRRALEDDPDVILLDLTMPGPDGITVARTLKKHARARAIPVVLVTATRDPNVKVEAFDAGADDYVTKPFDPLEMDARVRTMLRRRKQFLSLERTVADLSASNEGLEQLLMIDEMTGLYNFREFKRRMEQEWQRADRYGELLSLVFFDIDHFKQINDTRGHQAGDQVLQEFAALVAGGARANDVAARYGGEEFAVILPHTDNEMAIRVAERIRVAVQDFVFLSSTKPTRATVSGGVATYPSTGEVDSMVALIRAADRALYRAKDGGRNRICSHRAPAAEPRQTRSSIRSVEAGNPENRQ